MHQEIDNDYSEEFSLELVTERGILTRRLD